MPIFEPLDAPRHWRPSPLAAGPFAGLQGGAIASLLTAEIEAQAASRNWGTAIASAAWFLRPTPMADLRSEIRVVSEGGRVSVVIGGTELPVSRRHTRELRSVLTKRES